MGNLSSMNVLLHEHVPSPIQELQHDCLRQKRVRLLVKRDDLLRLHPASAFCGNKWRKLQYNIQEAHRQGQGSLLSFGGAFSNHLAAVAEAGQAFDFQTIGIVRGEEVDNPTLRFCQQCGMQLHFVSRTDYRQKDQPDFLSALQKRFGKFYLLPEGGSNALALKGCAEIVTEIQAQLPSGFPTHLAVACGTGGTLAGIAQKLHGASRLIGFPVLKGDFLQRDIERLLSDTTSGALPVFELQYDYHFGGYAKFSTALIHFMNRFKADFNIPLEPIYTGKLFYGLFDLIQKDFFRPGSTILAIHTGGLQGIAGFQERFGQLIM